MFKSLAKHADLGLLIGRLGVGAIFIVFGWHKLSGGQAVWTHYGHALASLGINFMPNVWGLVAALAEFAGGIGPGKTMVESRPELVDWAHAAGLRVTPWTFRATAPGRFENVRAEMAYHLSVLDVDAVITDNPDQFPVPNLSGL